MSRIRDVFYIMICFPFFLIALAASLVGYASINLTAWCMATIGYVMGDGFDMPGERDGVISVIFNRPRTTRVTK